MKKISILVASVSLISCQNNVPKCDDPEVFKTIYSILSENKDKIGDEYGHYPLYFYPNEKINSENISVTEIITNKKDTELNSCGCEGKLSIDKVEVDGNIEGKMKYEGLIEYSAQKNSEDNIIVKVENISPLDLKDK
jgi:hypothetical protein